MSRAEPNRSTRGLKPDWMQGPGPYIGRITNHLDPTNMGSLEVEILKTTGSGNESSETSSGYTIPCEYVSPFYGVTPRDGVSANEGFDYTQQSYGMWAIPPDIGVKVIVFFAQGNYGLGYWMGCIQDRNMNFMLPGNPSTTYNSENKSKPRPVGEYNKKTEKGAGKDATQYVKPCWKEQCAILDNQGLADDQTRGTNTSSARREVPSMVFGISTPGAYDRRAGKPKVKYGEKFAEAQIPFNRLGGSSIVMDDGDMSLLRKTFASQGGSEYVNVEAGEKGGQATVPHNEYLKLKTRTGHQILLHNSEDLIYISHGSGNSWIELTANGKIDIYANDSVSIRSENDLNFKADRDINLQAGRTINLNAVENINETATKNIEIKAGADGKITTAGKLDIDTPKTHVNNLDVTGKALVSEMVNVPTLQAGNVNGTGAGSPWPNSGPNQILPGYGASAPTAPTAAIDAKTPQRIPGHEPWDGHENIDPTLHTPDKTDSSTVTTPGKGKAGKTRDTFKKTLVR
tara:strand:- start:7578 stop:9122 length:1545 start_codon:yes stop_codon:yes gene_type:complete